MEDWTALQWIGVIGVAAGVIGAIIAFLQWRKRRADTDVSINVRKSKGAKVVGRDKGAGAAGDGAYRAEIDVEDSDDAEVTGRDDRR